MTILKKEVIKTDRQKKRREERLLKEAVSDRLELNKIIKTEDAFPFRQLETNIIEYIELLALVPIYVNTAKHSSPGISRLKVHAVKAWTVLCL